jgi:hypothetical protein
VISGRGLIWVPDDLGTLYRIELPDQGRPSISELPLEAKAESLVVLDDGVAVVHASTTGRVTFVGAARGARPRLHEGFLGLALGEGP